MVRDGVKRQIFGVRRLVRARALPAKLAKIVGLSWLARKSDVKTSEPSLVADSLEGLGRLVDEALETSDFERALGHVLQTVSHASKAAMKRRLLCHGSSVLDRICAEIGGRFRRSLVPTDATAFPAQRSGLPIDIYIASELYPHGGHTPLIGDCIRANPDRQAIVLVTNIANRQDSIKGPISDRLVLDADRVQVCNKCSLVDKLKWLSSAIDAIDPDRVLLFNHGHDCVAVAAIASENDMQAWFVHHVDRRPCLGAYYHGFVHVDVTPYCFAYCRAKDILTEHRYVPLTAVDHGCRDFANRRSEQKLTTASSGSASKFALDYWPSYVEVVARLLARTGGKHVHIGPLNHKFMQRFHEELEGRQVRKDRLIHVPYVPSVWKAMCEYNVDLFVGSFPVPGAKTSVEVMGSGTPMAWHASSEMTAFQATSMRYPEAVVWRHPTELDELIPQIGADWLKSQSKHARRHFEKTHHPDLTRKCLGCNCSALVPHALPEEILPRNGVEFDELLIGPTA